MEVERLLYGPKGTDPCEPDQEILVTVFKDGGGTIAFREGGYRTWGPAWPLEARTVD